MLLGQLKIDCIKKIRTDDNRTLDLDHIEDFKQDRDYQKYFNNVINSLNDGIRRLVIDEKIPFQTIEIVISTPISEIKKSDIATQANNIYRIKSVLYESEDGNIMAVDYSEIAGTYKLGTKYTKGKIIILYAPSVRLLTEEDPEDLDLETLGITELVCGYLTYFIKAELYEKTEPDAATKWRQYAEQYKSALDQEVTLPTQKKVRQVISLD